MKVSMYKRNQVELAISNWLEPKVRGPSQGLKTRIKRLLDTDRALGCSPRSHDQEKANFAFFREAAPGSGFEVWFSAYEAFALLLGLQLMAHNWPQRFVVSVLRRVRPEMEKEHNRILGLDPVELFDAKAVERARGPGSHAVDTRHPAYLVIVSHHGLSATQENRPYAFSVQPDIASASEWVRQTTKGVGGGSTMFELTVAAHSLARTLESTRPQSRGRAG
jgi:hypothetical protein